MTSERSKGGNRRHIFRDLHEVERDFREMSGWQRASIKRLIASDSAGVGLPPTDTYASGLVDLSVCASPLPLELDGGSVVSTVDGGMRFEFWNIDVFPGDEVLFGGDIYEVNRVESRTPSVVLGTIEVESGAVVLSAAAAPEAPVEAMCVISTKPAGVVSFKLQYDDIEGEARLSDTISFPADCKVGDVQPVMREGENAMVSQLSGISDLEGELGGGVVRVTDNCPFRTRVIASRKQQGAGG